MNDEFLRVAYETHHALFRHYSNQIFKTRVSIITALIIFFAYLLGIAPLADKPISPLTAAFLAWLSAFLVTLLFSVETAYYRRLTQVVQAARSIEGQLDRRLYFSILDTVSHWQLYGLYCSGIILFLGIAAWRLSFATWFPENFGFSALSTIVLALPLFLAAYTFSRFALIAEHGLAVEGSGTSTGRIKSGDQEPANSAR